MTRTVAPATRSSGACSCERGAQRVQVQNRELLVLRFSSWVVQVRASVSAERPCREPLGKPATSSSNSKQTAAAASKSISSSEQRAATANSEQQQQRAAASSSEQQRAAASSSEQQRAATAAGNTTVFIVHVDLAYSPCITRLYPGVRTPRISRINNQTRARHSYQFFLHSRIRHHRTQRHTTISHRETVGPPPLKGVITTFINTAQNESSQPRSNYSSITPRCGSDKGGVCRFGIWDCLDLGFGIAWIPPPVGKAGFEVWVLTKGGLVCIATSRPVRTVGSHHPIVHAHHLGRYAEPSGARVYRYGPVTKCNPFLSAIARSAYLQDGER